MPDEQKGHSEFRAAIQVLQDAYDHGHPDDLAKCPWAFETLDGLVEQYEVQRDKFVTLDAEYDRLKEQLEAARDVLRGIAENGACASDSRVADEYLRSSTGAGGGDGHLPHHPYPAKRPS